MEKSVLIVGGGTGGHISPGIALYEAFNKRNVAAYMLVGKRDKRFTSLEDVQENKLLLYNAPPLTKNIFKLPFFIINFVRAILYAKKVMKRLNTRAIIGMGGYVSAPALLAARMKKIPVYLCEQNTVPGKVTARFERSAKAIFGTFAITEKYLRNKVVYSVLGNPIRDIVFTSKSKEEAKKRFHLSHHKYVILVIGGSQGALSVNNLLFEINKRYPDELKQYGIIWSTGSYSYEIFKQKVQNEMDAGSVYISPFINEIGDAYKVCDVAISRSGSGVMVELAAMGIPSILIPYPHAAANHQEINADAFVDEGAAIKVNQNDELVENVITALNSLLKNPRALKDMSQQCLSVAKKDAAQNIAAHIIDIEGLGQVALKSAS